MELEVGLLPPDVLPSQVELPGQPVRVPREAGRLHKIGLVLLGVTVLVLVLLVLGLGLAELLLLEGGELLEELRLDDVAQTEGLERKKSSEL